jgi:phytanoyl-CoA hydroxylase
MDKLQALLSYETQGFVHLPRVLSPEFLARLQPAFDKAAVKHAERWLADGDKAQPAFTINRILDENDVFVDLVDLPTIFPLLVEILGVDIQLMITQARLFRPGTTFVPPWHSDLDGVGGIDPGLNPRFLAKIHFYPEDLSPDQGCLAFIPGSHRYPVGAPRPKIDYHQDWSVVKKIVPKAGDAVLFNPHIFHMCLDNLSARNRKSLIYTYGHFWMKNYPSAVPRELDRLATTQQRKQLFGISSVANGDYFDQSLEGQGSGMKEEVDGLLRSGRHLLSKAKQIYWTPSKH